MAARTGSNFMGSKTAKTMLIGMAISAACALRAHRLLVMQRLREELEIRSAELNQAQAELITLQAEERNPLSAIYALAEVASNPLETSSRLEYNSNGTVWLSGEDFDVDARPTPQDTQSSSLRRPLSV